MKKIAFACCLGVIGILTSEFGVIGILPQIAETYHITIDKAGILLSAFAIVVAVAGPFMSLFCSGFDRKTVMLISLSLVLISGIVSAFGPPFWLLLAVRVLPAFLHAVYYAAAIAAVIRTSDTKNQHTMMAIALSGVSIATVSTIPLSTYLASLLNWHYSFMLVALISTLAILSIYLVMPAMPVTEKPSYGSQVRILKRPQVVISLLMILLMFAAEFSTYTYFAAYIGLTKLVSPKGISYMLFLFGVAAVIGTWIAGKTLGKSITITNIAALVGCNLIIPAALYFSGHVTTSVAVIVAIWGIFYGPGFLIATSAISKAAPDALEFSNGLATSFANFGITLGSLSGGWVIAHQGIGQLPFPAACFGVLALVFIAVGVNWEKRIEAQVSEVFPQELI
ncbi:MFS transporter [Mucilaginibacter sp.]|jgi:predicted MFS family arabinose efflux permease|uniref:MFS transporter n=1 Tax=Mucilaginibacter sp. TaxID=1882438 RepID=UPI0035634E3B